MIPKIMVISSKVSNKSVSPPDGFDRIPKLKISVHPTLSQSIQGSSSVEIGSVSGDLNTYVITNCS